MIQEMGYTTATAKEWVMKWLVRKALRTILMTTAREWGIHLDEKGYADRIGRGDFRRIKDASSGSSGLQEGSWV
jgi:hypothetical protein